MDIDVLTKKLADEGYVIEAGWQALKAQVLEGAPDVQVREMRKAFFSGAQHLFASILGFLDSGEEPTTDDLRRMEMVSVELDAFVDELRREAKGIH